LVLENPSQGKWLLPKKIMSQRKQTTPDRRVPCLLRRIGFFPGLFPNRRNLLLDLGDFVLVVPTIVVRNHGFELGHFLGILPIVLGTGMVRKAASSSAAALVSLGFLSQNTATSVIAGGPKTHSHKRRSYLLGKSDLLFDDGVL
jgi:hypothetical protein